MPDAHEPDPRFVDRLEWQLGGELRRRYRGGAMQWSSYRALKIAGLMLISVAGGAAAVSASQQIGESWRRELLEARLEVQLELARQRVQMHTEVAAQARDAARLGVGGERELMYVEVRIVQAQADARFMELELEEIKGSGREPLGEVSSPLVDGRDFVSERIRVRMEVARHHLDVVQREEELARQRAEVGVGAEGELRERALVTAEAELQVLVLEKQLDVRSAYLASEISAVEAELRLLESEAQNRVVLLDLRRQHLSVELDRLEAAIAAGTVSPLVAAQMRTRVAENEAQIRLAQAEREIVRRELEKRASRQ
jgi:hypothetical protein